MLSAAIKDTPVYGGKLKSYDESKVAKMPGVRKVVRVSDSAVAVVADTWWQAKTALDALPIVWDEGENAKVSSATIAQHLETGLTSAETNGDRRDRRCASRDRRCGEEGRGDLFDPVPLACLHGGDERHRADHGRQGRMLDADAEPGSLAGGVVGGLGPAALAMRSLPA